MEAKIRRWGSSLGIVFPSEVIRKESLQEGDEIVIGIKKNKSLEGVFGSLRGWDPK